MPAKKALVVAINDYGGDGRNNLPSCINDGEAFRTILQQKYAYSDIRTLFDAEANEAKVEAELDALVKDAKPDDRLVFFFSGHGFSKVTDGVQEEFIVLRDGGGPFLYIDNKFAAKLRNLPPGVFTAVMDCCFSAGTYKDFVFDDSGATPKVEEFLNKRLPFPPDEEVKALTKSFSLPASGPGGTAPAAATGAAGTATAATAATRTAAATATAPAVAAQPAVAPAPSIIRTYRRFGCFPTSSPAVLSRVYRRAPGGSAASALDKALSDPTEQPQPEVSGILYAACQEFETAAASTSQTQGLSAFTYALRHSLDRIGHTKSGVEVFAATASRLQELNFKQTPVLLERAAPGDLKHRTFISSQSPKSAEMVAADKAFGAAVVDEKLFGAIIGRLAEVIPQVAPIVFDAVVGRHKGMAGYVPLASDPAAEEKFIGAILGTLAQVIPQVAPIIIDAVTTQRKQVASAGMFGEPEAGPQADEKFLPLLIGALASTIPHVAPMIINAVSGRRKELEGASMLGGATQSEADDKFFGAILGAVASVIPQVAPIIIDAVAGRRKELEGGGTTTASVQADEKFIGAILGTLAQVIPHVAPLVIDAVAGRRKAIGGLGAAGSAFEPDEKFLGDLLRTVVRAVPYVVPRIVDAVAGRRKELVGVTAGGTVEADEKFLGAVLGTLAQVIPHVAPVIIDAITGRRKEIAGAPALAGMGSLAAPPADEKFLGAIIGAVAQVIPHVAPIIIDAIAGRRKELEGLSLTGSASGAQADEKWLGGIITRCFQTLPPLLPPILTQARANMGMSTKGFEGGFEPAAGGQEVDEKFLGAVLGAAVSLAPTIIQALTARRKEFGGELGGPAQPEVDEKFLGAVLRTAVALAPTLIQTLTARQKEFNLGQLGGPPSQGDEKFLLSSLISPTVPQPAPWILPAWGAQRKELGDLTGTAQPAVDEKFLGSVLRAAVSLAPTLVQLLGGKQKELGLIEPSGGAQPQVDEKFLGAVLSAAVSLAPTIIEALSGRQKAFSAGESTPGTAQVDEKFLGAVLRTAVALAPTLLQTLTRQKELGGMQPQGSLSSYAT